jgi:ABC-2 type transport system ATP-binding protein
MSSHLLTEIERVCEYLVVIEGGRLVRSDPLSTFTGRTELVTVEVEGAAAALAAYLRERYAPREDTRVLELEAHDDAAYDAIRDGAASLGIGLVRVEQGRRHLEDLFRDEEPEHV